MSNLEKVDAMLGRYSRLKSHQDEREIEVELQSHCFQQNAYPLSEVINKY